MAIKCIEMSTQGIEVNKKDELSENNPSGHVTIVWNLKHSKEQGFTKLSSKNWTTLR